MVKADIYPITKANLTMFDPGRFEVNMHYIIGNTTMDAVAFVIGKEAVAFGGVHRMPWSICEGFFDSLPGTPPFVFAQARRVWYELTEGVRRAQFQVDILKPKHIRFGYSLGLKPEGVMMSAGPDGEDYILFARVL
jgi:hypothetical protein